MAEYIELETAVRLFENFDAGRGDGQSTMLTPEEFAEYLYEVPPADVAPVVRCRDCKHEFGGSCIICGFQQRGPEDFCSYGERKECAEC